MWLRIAQLLKEHTWIRLLFHFRKVYNSTGCYSLLSSWKLMCLQWWWPPFATPTMPDVVGRFHCKINRIFQKWVSSFQQCHFHSCQPLHIHTKCQQLLRTNLSLQGRNWIVLQSACRTNCAQLPSNLKCNRMTPMEWRRAAKLSCIIAPRNGWAFWWKSYESGGKWILLQRHTGKWNHWQNIILPLFTHLPLVQNSTLIFLPSLSGDHCMQGRISLDHSPVSRDNDSGSSW